MPTSRPPIDAGTFREDLYDRLNGLSIQVLPLRERTEDIPNLATHFLSEAAGVEPRPAPDGILHGQAEARFVQKGARTQVQQGTVEVTDKLNYVDVSLLAKPPLPMSRTITPHLQGGLSSNVGFSGVWELDGPTRDRGSGDRQGGYRASLLQGGLCQFGSPSGSGRALKWVAPLRSCVLQ